MENSLQTLPFIKMHGAGNDFILFDNRSLKLDEDEITELAPVICDRKFGAGSDGLIALTFDETKQADLHMIYKNPDGSDAGMCGNGARCFAAYAVTLGSPRNFTFRVHQNIYQADVSDESVVIHFPLETRVTEQVVANEAILNIHTNTEHIVCTSLLEDLEDRDQLIQKGKFFRNHPEFQPKGTNVNFIAGIDNDSLCLQTYERGVENLTLACGTGAIASALGWHYLQQGSDGEHRYQVRVKGGTLYVNFSFDSSLNQYHQIKLEGPVSFVYKAEFYY